MTLTRGAAPLAAHPAPGNYTIDGPKHRIFWEPHPRRVRAELAGATVFDTTSGALLHETNILPVLYVPLADFDRSLFRDSELITHCPFKGNAAYWSLKVGDRVATDAVWTYPEPIVDFLAGHAAVYWDRVDRWLEEETEVFGHLRDPYARVDARPSTRRVEVRLGDEVVASSGEPFLLFETNLQTRAYLLRDEVTGVLERSETRTICPYKGRATYWNLRLGDRLLEDAAWSYEPIDVLPDGPDDIAGRVSFEHDELAVVLDA